VFRDKIDWALCKWGRHTSQQQRRARRTRVLWPTPFIRVLDCIASYVLTAQRRGGFHDKYSARRKITEVLVNFLKRFCHVYIPANNGGRCDNLKLVSCLVGWLSDNIKIMVADVVLLCIRSIYRRNETLYYGLSPDMCIFREGQKVILLRDFGSFSKLLNRGQWMQSKTREQFYHFWK